MFSLPAPAGRDSLRQPDNVKGGDYCGKERGYLLTADLTQLQESERVSFAERYFYVDYNVTKDKKRLKEMMQKSGQLGVPVILVDDDVLIGFNQPKLDKLLS